ncbi:hypothetical protein FRC08_017253, partial [Ceratobasidium sp. 394]
PLALEHPPPSLTPFFSPRVDCSLSDCAASPPRSFPFFHRLHCVLSPTTSTAAERFCVSLEQFSASAGAALAHRAPTLLNMLPNTLLALFAAVVIVPLNGAAAIHGSYVHSHARRSLEHAGSYRHRVRVSAVDLGIQHRKRGLLDNVLENAVDTLTATDTPTSTADAPTSTSDA